MEDDSKAFSYNAVEKKAYMRNILTGETTEVALEDVPEEIRVMFDMDLE